jgi:hypothetical protein
MAQGVGPEFKRQSAKKKKKASQRHFSIINLITNHNIEKNRSPCLRIGA